MKLLKLTISIILVAFVSPIVLIAHVALYGAIYGDEDMRPILIKHGGFWGYYFDGLKSLLYNFQH